eukprot:1385929-Amorphochlora_amoeboformis.AAC.1
MGTLINLHSVYLTAFLSEKAKSYDVRGKIVGYNMECLRHALDFTERTPRLKEQALLAVELDRLNI